MEVRDLQYFVVAAELGQFRQAAERIGRSQSALTKCIDRLEVELGTQLFERVGRGVRLTSAGEALVVHAKMISLNVRDAVREVKDVGQGFSGHIRIGSGPTTADWLLPNILGPLMSQSASLSFQIITGLGDGLRQALSDGKLDLVVGPIFERDAADFAIHDIAEDTMVVAARPDHPLAGRQVATQDLVPYRWLLPIQPLASTQWLRRTFEARGLPLPVAQIEADAVTQLRRLVARSDLLTFVSRRDLDGAAGAPLAAIEVIDLSFSRRLGVVCMKNRYVPPLAMRLIERLMAEGQAILDQPF